jgi:anti-sigma-K factor RskA
MTDTHEAFAELAAGYALGALDAGDAARLELHLAEGCAECVRALAEYRDVLVRVAEDLREAPPPEVRRELVARVGPAVRSRRIGLVVGWATSLALAAGVAAVVTGGLVSGRYEARLGEMARAAADLRAELDQQVRAVGDLRRQLDEQERTITLVKAESAEQTRTITLLSDPETRVVSLVGLKPSPDARARVLWNPRAGGLLVAAALPPAPAGKIYELWAIAGGKPMPAGLFGVDAAGGGSLRVAPIEGVGAVDVFAVTLEPAGGVPSPTGEMYLASKPA